MRRPRTVKWPERTCFSARRMQQLLFQLQDQTWRRSPNVSPFFRMEGDSWYSQVCGCTLQKQPNFSSSNQGRFQIREKDATVNSCGVPWRTPPELTRVKPQQLPEAASGLSALTAARSDAEAPSTQLLPEGQGHAETPTCLLSSALPIDTELVSRKSWEKGFSAQQAELSILSAGYSVVDSESVEDNSVLLPLGNLFV